MHVYEIWVTEYEIVIGKRVKNKGYNLLLFISYRCQGKRICFSFYINEVIGILLAGVTVNFLLSQVRWAAWMSGEGWVRVVNPLWCWPAVPKETGM